MRARCTIEFAIDHSDGDVDFIGPTLAPKQQRRSAMTAEGSLRTDVGLVRHQFVPSLRAGDVGCLEASPRYKGSAVGSTAVVAVTVRHPQSGELQLELDATAKAGRR
ncbi:MAG: hypothetical protein ACI8TQ_003083 [Planctomycetota bacterium]|jgi:hypothetical protein